MIISSFHSSLLQMVSPITVIQDRPKWTTKIVVFWYQKTKIRHIIKVIYMHICCVCVCCVCLGLSFVDVEVNILKFNEIHVFNGCSLSWNFFLNGSWRYYLFFWYTQYIYLLLLLYIVDFRASSSTSFLFIFM